MDSAFAMGSGPSQVTTLPNAKDLSHHLNRITKNRTANNLKELYKYASMPGMLSMAGGTPSPANFPFETVSATILPYDHLPLDPPRVPGKAKKSLLSWLFGESLASFTIPKWSEDPKAVQLSTALQYQTATGIPPLAEFLHKYVEEVYKPGYADWDVLVNVGATDGMAKVVSMLLELGDSILVEEWTYPGAANAYLPFEVKVVALTMDGEGIIPEYMDHVLGNWDEAVQGKRPRVLYTVPTGQNPTGATMTLERKQEIYKVAVKYDIIIIEDEPYYCLFAGPYVPRDKKPSPLLQQQLDAEKKPGKEGNDAFIKSLPPSFLRVDTEGRVIRLDTFSKTACPGSRMGWTTSSPLFIERLTRISESSTQQPSGFAEVMICGMLNTYGFDNYVRWLRGLKATYRMRRDWVIDALVDTFHLEVDDGVIRNPLVRDIIGGRAYTAYSLPEAGSREAKWDEKRGQSSANGKPLVSFIPPTAGMFVFLAVHLDQHPDFDSSRDDSTAELARKLWVELAENLVLFAPGNAFDAHGPHAIGGKGTAYFRLSYSMMTYEETRKAITVFSKVLKKFLKA